MRRITFIPEDINSLDSYLGTGLWREPIVIEGDQRLSTTEAVQRYAEQTGMKPGESRVVYVVHQGSKSLAARMRITVPGIPAPPATWERA